MKKILILILCVFIANEFTFAESFSQGLCSGELTMSQNLKAPEKGEGYIKNGSHHWYTKGTVTEAHILQKHLNRLGFNAGKVDGIIGPNTKGAILRMQKFLGTKEDGFVGPLTRNLLNNSCGDKKNISQENAQKIANELNQNGIKIIKPLNSKTFNAGDTIEIELETDPEINKVMIMGTEIGSGMDGKNNLFIQKEITKSKNTFEYKIPEKIIDNIRILVFAYNTNVTAPNLALIGTDTIEINIKPSSTVVSLEIYSPESLLFISDTYVGTVTLSAYRSDGEKYQVSAVNDEIKYYIEDTNIAEYYWGNMILGKKEGNTNLTVTYQGSSITIPIAVYPGDALHTPPPKPKNN